MTHEYSVERAKEYQKKHQILDLVQLAVTPVLLWISVVTPLSLFFALSAMQITPNLYLQVLLYFVFFSLFLLIFDVPFSFYGGFVLEHRYGLSNQTFFAWIGNFLKKSVLSFVLSAFLIEVLYLLLWRFPDRWWLLGWAGFVFVSYVLGKIFPVFIVPLFYKYGKVEDESLKKRILDLAARYGLPVENVYSLNLSKTTKKANAAFMGIGRTKRVVLSDTLIENFSGDEIEVVVAHELGHFKHKDIWKQLAFGMAVSFLAFWLAFRFLDSAALHYGFLGAGDIGALPLLFLIFYVVYLVLTPLQTGFSRMIERAADRFALKAYPRPDIFISCMEKLAKVNLADPNPHPLIEWFFYDHPAIGKRITMAKKLLEHSRRGNS